MAEGDACGGGLGHVNHVLVKQLASIHADGDNLARRLHNLRAAAAAAASSPRPPPQTASALADDKTDIVSSTASVVRSPSSAARRKGHGHGHGDSLNGDVLKLCSLTKMLTEENERLQALVCKMDTDLREVRAQAEVSLERELGAARSSAMESEARLKAAMQELDDAMGAMELLRCEKERLEQENARLLEENENEHRQLCSGSGRAREDDDDGDGGCSQGEGQPSCCALLCVSKGSSKQKCVITVLEREASRMLQGKHKLQADDHAFVRMELRRLVMDFVQGLMFKVEEEVAKRSPTAAAAEGPNGVEMMVEAEPREVKVLSTLQDAEEEEQQHVRRPNVIKYALPAATILVAGVVTYFTAVSKQKSC